MSNPAGAGFARGPRKKAASSHLHGLKKRDIQKDVSFLVREAGRRRRKLRIPRFCLSAKALSLRCGSFPHANRSVGSARGPRKKAASSHPHGPKRKTGKSLSFFLVREAGLEPARP